MSRPRLPVLQDLDTLPKLLLHNAANWPNELAMREKEFGIWHEFTWAAYRDQVRLIALGLAAFGAYSLMATTVAQRRREIGVRMALGATARHVLALTMRQGATPVVAGIVVGLAAAIALTRVLARTLFGLLTPDLLLVAGVAVLLAGVALAATIIPARRAARLNPAVVIRE